MWDLGLWQISFLLSYFSPAIDDVLCSMSRLTVNNTYWHFFVSVIVGSQLQNFFFSVNYKCVIIGIDSVFSYNSRLAFSSMFSVAKKYHFACYRAVRFFLWLVEFNLYVWINFCFILFFHSWCAERFFFITIESRAISIMIRILLAWWHVKPHIILFYNSLLSLPYFELLREW